MAKEYISSPYKEVNINAHYLTKPKKKKYKLSKFYKARTRHTKDILDDI